MWRYMRLHTPSTFGPSAEVPMRDFDDISQDHYELVQLNPPIAEENKLYPRATLTKFQFELLLLNLQATHGWSNSSMNIFLR